MNSLKPSTGLSGLDGILKGLLPGDNVVWQVNTVDDYIPFVQPLCQRAMEYGIPCVYFRFAKHKPIVPDDWGVTIERLNPEVGFEQFIAQIHKMIERTPRGAYYVFDLLSELAVDWCSDRMVGNFFMLTCPYLFDMETIAYFGILRNMHTSHALTPITETTQLFLNVYRHHEQLYIHPHKVLHRYSPTMYMLHAWENEKFLPITESATITEILTATPWAALEPFHRQHGAWDRAFLRVEEVWNDSQRGQCPQEDVTQTLHNALRLILTRDERMLHLAERYMTLGDVLDLRSRTIGTGLIGGKAGGMYLARAILRKTAHRWIDLLEPHDSFFIGSDVFYTYLVQNGCWWVRQKQRQRETFMDGAEDVRRRILTGTFPDDIRQEFISLLNYFGQSPIIVRSSSLLEDNFGNAFAGKYDSLFLINQGPPEKRLEDFMSAVRSIYASTMSEKALHYRAQRGLLERDEQMALLIQRVSGSLYGHLFFPQMAGVALSYNPYRWHEMIDPEAGVVRLVFGLGTRAVDRFDDDYTRVVALNAPERRPEHNFDEICQYAQRRVDVLDWEANQLITEDFLTVIHHKNQALPLQMFASGGPDGEMNVQDSACPPVLTFDRLLAETPFVSDMREMLAIVKEAYDYPIEMEFSASFQKNGLYRINVLQCRPLQVQGGGLGVELPQNLPEDKIIFSAQGAVIGQSRLSTVNRIIYVDPSVYGRMSMSERYGVARRIGQLVNLKPPLQSDNIMLLGPGRWGTTHPTLGICVSFAEIGPVRILCEIVQMHEHLTPEVSLGTHFFNELVESEILYLALFPGREGNWLRPDFFEHTPNKLPQLAPEMKNWKHAIRVFDIADLPGQQKISVCANTLQQSVICHLE